MINAIDAALEASARSLLKLPPEFYSLKGEPRRALCEKLVSKVCGDPSAEAFSAYLVGRGYRITPRKPKRPAPRTGISRVAVAACYFNPAGFRNRLRNYQRFAWSLSRQGVELHTIELVLDNDRPALEGENVIRVHGTRERNCVWQKERLLNLLVERLPAAIDGVVCADVDLVWDQDDWLEETRRALELFPVVHPFSYVKRFNQAGDAHDRRLGIGWAMAQGLPYEQPFLALPGYAWAARRSFWERAKWFDWMITGSGDCAFVSALMGAELPKDYSPRLAPIPTPLEILRQQWAARVYAEVGGNVGAIASEISHCWHGDDRDRCYIPRHKALAAAGFKSGDIEIDANGLIAWKDPRSKLAEVMREFFFSRREDGV